MCMSKGIPKKPEFGPCQEQHSLSQMGNLNDPKMFGEAMRLIGFAAVMVPMINLMMKAYSNSTTAAALP